MGLIDLGLTDAEFGRLTMKEFDVLLRRKVKRDENETLKFGMIAAAVYNTMRRKRTDKVFKATDFISKRRVQRTADEIFAKVKAINAFFNGSRK